MTSIVHKKAVLLSAPPEAEADEESFSREGRDLRDALPAKATSEDLHGFVEGGCDAPPLIADCVD